MEGIDCVDDERNGKAQPHKFVSEEGIDQSPVLPRHLQGNLDKGEDELFPLYPLSTENRGEANHHKEEEEGEERPG